MIQALYDRWRQDAPGIIQSSPFDTNASVARRDRSEMCLISLSLSVSFQNWERAECHSFTHTIFDLVPSLPRDEHITLQTYGVDLELE